MRTHDCVACHPEYVPAPDFQNIRTDCKYGMHFSSTTSLRNAVFDLGGYLFSFNGFYRCSFHGIERHFAFHQHGAGDSSRGHG